jgi:hypothetical protein
VRESSCDELRDALLEGRSGTEPALAAHAEQCEQCATLLLDQALVGRALATGPPLPAAGAELWSGLDRALSDETGPRSWLRSRSTRLRIALALGMLVVVMLLGTARLRSDFRSVSSVGLATWLGAFTLAGLGVIALALPDLGRRRATPRGWLAWPLVALALPAAYALIGWYTLEQIPWPPYPPLLQPALACFGYGILLSVPLLALFWLLDRGAGPRSRVLAAAAATGLAANGALLLHCSSMHEPHLLLGHATIGVTLALAGWALVSRGRPA